MSCFTQPPSPHTFETHVHRRLPPSSRKHVFIGAAWLQRRPVSFSIAGAGYRLRACRLGVVEIDLLSGWLRSRGRLPCLGVVVGGLEVFVEGLAAGAAEGGDTGVKS